MTNFETCLNWLKTQDKEAAEYYEKNTDEVRVDRDEVENAINCAFLWCSSPQGNDFWYALEGKWFEYLQDLETAPNGALKQAAEDYKSKKEDQRNLLINIIKDYEKDGLYDTPTTEKDFKTLLDEFWSDYRDFLLEKDSKYGSRYLKPLNVFCDLNPMDRLNARLDEKLGRLLAGSTDEDTLDDILGLLIHRKVLQKNASK